MTTNRSENDLLLYCATTYGGLEKVARIDELIQKDINWACLVQMARRHGTMPLLYWNLKEADSKGIPQDIMKELGDEFRINILRNLFLTGQLLKLLDLFQAHEIPAIPYKGPTLSVLAYGDVCLRHFCDLDFIVHKHDVMKAKELLLSVGYAPEYMLPRPQELAYLDHECEYNFYQEKTNVLIELHWDILQKYFSCHFDLNELWDRLKPVFLVGRKVMTIPPEHLLLVLCLHHGGKHQWEMLGWICDIAQLIRVRKDLDWERILDNAFRSGIERILLLGLYLAKDMLGADIPNEIEKRLMNDTVIISLAEEVRKRIFTEAENPPGEAERFVFYLRMRENVKDKMQYCFRRLFTSTKTDWALLRLPAPLFPFYRFLRPFRLVKKFGRRALG